MWKRNEVSCRSIKVELPGFADHIGQRVKWQELGDCQSAHREHQFGSKKIELAPQPVGTFLNLELVGNPIATMGIFSRKAAADSRKVDPAAHRFFIPSDCGVKPAKERLARCPSEWTTKERFLTTRSLSDQEDAAGHRASHHYRLVHARTSAAVRQGLKVRAERAHDPPKSTDAIRKAR